ncbi:MAG: hypothetical protein BroJett029_17740 [Alphaproteobacteria bacterium]|nr:MAG: hypothetical protein BroJett029_17740 [Alphaproteobacteria bacterium]
MPQSRVAKLQHLRSAGGDQPYECVKLADRRSRPRAPPLRGALSELRLQISSARMATCGERAIDVFYVKDQFGLKIDNETRLKGIREALMEALQDPADGAPAETAAAE